MPSKASQMAISIRESLWGDHIPVDPVAIAKKLGIEVYETELPAAVSGAIVKQKGRDAQILVQKDDSDNRKRFTIAHELGHFIAHSEDAGANTATFEYVDLRDPQASNGSNPQEIFANQFAAELLMPESKLRAIYPKVPATAILAARFSVSIEAMDYRLANLGLVRAVQRAAAAG